MKVRSVLEVIPQSENDFRLYVSELTGGYELTEKVKCHLEIQHDCVVLSVNKKFSATVDDLRKCGAENISIKDGNKTYNVLSYSICYKDKSVVFYYLRRK